MKQIKTLLFASLILSIIPVSVIGQDHGTYQYAINQVDINVQNVIAKRKTNSENQKNINAFVTEAGKWFEARSNIKKKINQAKNNQSSQQYIQQLEQEQKAINSLNGGVTIDWKTYNSMDDLKNDLTEKSLEMVQLINEDEKLKNELKSLDIERDNYVAKAEKDEKTDQKNLLWDKIQYLKKKFKSNYEEYSKTSQNKVNDAIWCTKKDGSSSLKCLHRNLYISALTETYIREIRKSGKEYDQNKLVEMIKNAQSESIKLKKEATYMLREWYELIKGMEQEIANLENKYRNWEEPDNNIDPSGCWLIVIGNGVKPMVEIKAKPFEEFVGIVTRTGTIHEKYQNRVLFRLTRVNATTFEGYEYEYSDKGTRKGSVPVRIIINKNRTGIDYRTSDNILNLRPCNN